MTKKDFDNAIRKIASAIMWGFAVLGVLMAAAIILGTTPTPPNDPPWTTSTKLDVQLILGYGGKFIDDHTYRICVANFYVEGKSGGGLNYTTNRCWGNPK